MSDIALSLSVRAHECVRAGLTTLVRTDDSVVPNPAPSLPSEVVSKSSDVMAMVKGGVLVIIVLCAFVGVGGLVAAKVVGSHGAGKWGMQVMLAAFAAAVFFAIIYGVLQALWS